MRDGIADGVVLGVADEIADPLFVGPAVSWSLKSASDAAVDVRLRRPLGGKERGRGVVAAGITRAGGWSGAATPP